MDMAITRADGTLKQAAVDLKNTLAPHIASGDINFTYQPWAVWLSGRNFMEYMVAILDTDSQTWTDTTPTTISTDASWVSFQLPSNIAPARCNIEKECITKVSLKNSLSGSRSNAINLTLPAITTGDANFDGVVDDSDFFIWIQNYAVVTDKQFSAGDFNFDAKSNVLDFSIWQLHKTN